MPRACGSPSGVLNLKSMIVSLDDFKRHLRQDFLNTKEDEYMRLLLETALDACLRVVNRDLEQVRDVPAFKFAVMLLAAHWYNQREPVDTAQLGEVPYTIEFLLTPLTVYYEDGETA